MILNWAWSKNALSWNTNTTQQPPVAAASADGWLGLRLQVVGAAAAQFVRTHARQFQCRGVKVPVGAARLMLASLLSVYVRVRLRKATPVREKKQEDEYQCS